MLMLLPSRGAADVEHSQRIGIIPGGTQNFFHSSAFVRNSLALRYRTYSRFLGFQASSLAMAKSARASEVKRNHRKLRATVFGPAHDARTARLSAKLQELAAKPKPETEKAMDVDEKNEDGAEDRSSNGNTEGIIPRRFQPQQSLIRRCRNGSR